MFLFDKHAIIEASVGRLDRVGEAMCRAWASLEVTIGWYLSDASFVIQRGAATT